MKKDEIIDTREVESPLLIADDFVIALAKNAEARIDAVRGIKRVALKVTNVEDWVDQQGKPYLMASGSEKIANLFGISWTLLERAERATDIEGHYTYVYRGTFTMGGRSIDAEGSRSSREGFFRQYTGEGQARKERPLADRDNERDVKMAAFTNLLGNGITRLLGIRNLTWEDLASVAEITREQVTNKVSYRGNKGKNPSTLGEPQAKPLVVEIMVKDVLTKKGKKGGKDWVLYTVVDENGVGFSTFSESFVAVAKEGIKMGEPVEICYIVTQWGNEISDIAIKPIPPGAPK